MKKILVIDDDPDILEVVNLVLNMEGYDTKGLSKGDEVFKRIEEYHPDLMVLDVLLSGNDGRSICRLLKHNNRTKNIPVIMMSAQSDIKDSVMESGANSFIPKPFSIDDLIHQVSGYIGKP